MRYLIDTHVLIWYINGDESLPEKYISLMHNPQNKLSVSIVTMWELTIKMALNKLKCDRSLQEIEQYILSRDFEVLNISFDHLNALSTLPYHHGDPFDRLLIAQAIREKLPIISSDRHFSSYDVEVIW